jgi:8-oxo-dGTP diphosphatase
MKKKSDIEIIARGVCIRNGRLLLCHTKGAHNTYLPGGHVECGESAKDSLAREIKEELGRNAKVGNFLGAVEHCYTRGRQRCCEINLVFELRISGVDSSRAPVSQEDFIEFWWGSLSDLSRSKLEPVVLRRVLPSWLRNKTPERWDSTY